MSSARNPLRRVIERYFHHSGHLDAGLAELHANLGLDQSSHTETAVRAVTVTTPTQDHAPTFVAASLL